MRKSLPSLLVACVSIAAAPFTTALNAQCDAGEMEVTIIASTDSYGYEVYWELLPGGNACGNGTIFSGGNGAVGCNGAGAQDQPSGGYGNNQSYTEGPWCLTEGASYDIFWADDWGDGGLEFQVLVDGVSVAEFTGTGEGQTFTFVVEPPPARDMSATMIHSAKYVFENTEVVISGMIKSLGADVVTSFDLNYTLDGGPAVTDPINGVSLNAGDVYHFEHSATWTPTQPGNTVISIWASNINGLDDLNPDNDAVAKEMVVNAPIPNIVDEYLTGDPQVIEVANDDHDLLVPRDLDFHPDLARNELWVVNKDTEASGSSTVTFFDIVAETLDFTRLEDGNNWHFMSLATGLAMGDNGDFATSPGVFDANHNGGAPFTGPSLWSADLTIYAQPSGGNGSHLDMLHVNPECQGIAHDHLNRYWVTDGYNSDVTMVDFMMDHGPGNDDHADAVIRRYQEFSITKDPNDHIVSHLVLDKPTGWLYVVDHGGQRVLRLDINSGTPGGTPSWPAGGPYEPYEEYSVVNGYTWEEVITTGLVQPAGIDVIGDRLLVSDHSNGDIIIYDISVIPAVELGRINTNSPGIMGITIGPDGRVWAVNATTHALIVVDPDGFTVGAPELEGNDLLQAYPNPATNEVIVFLDRYTAGAATLDLMDAAGRMVHREGMVRNQLRIDVSGLPAGAYHLRATLDSGQQLQRRLMVVH